MRRQITYPRIVQKRLQAFWNRPTGTLVSFSAGVKCPGAVWKAQNLMQNGFGSQQEARKSVSGVFMARNCENTNVSTMSLPKSILVPYQNTWYPI